MREDALSIVLLRVLAFARLHIAFNCGWWNLLENKRWRSRHILIFIFVLRRWGWREGSLG